MPFNKATKPAEPVGKGGSRQQELSTWRWSMAGGSLPGTHQADRAHVGKGWREGDPERTLHGRRRRLAPAGAHGQQRLDPVAACTGAQAA